MNSKSLEYEEVLYFDLQPHPMACKNGESEKAFLLTSKFVSKGLSAPALGLYTGINNEKICIKSAFEEILF